jgi:DNA processing protein
MEPARLRAILARAPGLVARHLKIATATTGTATDVLRADSLPALLAQRLPTRAKAWLESPDHRLIDSDLRWIEVNHARILCCLDPGYPPALAAADGSPAMLYVCGDPRPLARPTLAIVGTPQASAAGIETASRFAAQLARAGLSIVSALAEGIATAAHQGALAVGGPCIGVCTAGLDRIHPARSAQLAAQIRDRGGSLVSLFAPGTPPRRYHFPLRNRLIAALAAGVLVVEADDGSGALSLAAQARRLQRRVFAIPGSIRDPHSRPCNQLIRDGATLVQQSSELLEDLNLNNIQSVTEARPARDGSPPLDNKSEMLLDAAGFEPVDIDVLALRTGWSGHAIASMLLLLELQGRIAPQPGGRYCRLS